MKKLDKTTVCLIIIRQLEISMEDFLPKIEKSLTFEEIEKIIRELNYCANRTSANRKEAYLTCPEEISSKLSTPKKIIEFFS